MKYFSLLIVLIASFSLSAQITTYFNQNQSSQFSDPYRNVARAGDNFEQILADGILSARQRVWVAVYELSLPRVAAALAEQKSKGLDVRVITDNSNHYELSQLTPDQVNLLDTDMKDKYQEFLLISDRNHDGVATKIERENADAMYVLRRANISIIDDTADGTAGSGLMHHKFLIIDDRVVFTGSNNYTPSCSFGDMSDNRTRGNSNSLLKIEDAGVNRAFATEFTQMWGSNTFSPKFGNKKPFREAQTFSLADGKKITLHFSPFSPKIAWEKTSNGLIAKQILSAKKSIKFALFVLSEQVFSNAMEIVNKNGVAISGLIDPMFVFQYYSGALDLLGVDRINYRCEYQKNNKVWANPIRTVGTARMGYGDKLHHKFGVIDDRYTIVGSHNWSEAANSTNDETLMIIDSPSVAANYTTEFNRLAANAAWGVPVSVQEKINLEKNNCN